MAFDVTETCDELLFGEGDNCIGEELDGKDFAGVIGKSEGRKRDLSGTSHFKFQQCMSPVVNKLKMKYSSKKS